MLFDTIKRDNLASFKEGVSKASVELSIPEFAALELRNPVDETLFMASTKVRESCIFDYLISKDTDITAKTSSGKTALVISIRRKDISKTRRIIGIHPETALEVDNRGRNCISHAILACNGAARDFLLSLNPMPDVNQAERLTMATPIMHSASLDDTESIMILKRHGADPHKLDCKGRSAEDYSENLLTKLTLRLDSPNEIRKALLHFKSQQEKKVLKQSLKAYPY